MPPFGVDLTEKVKFEDIKNPPPDVEDFQQIAESEDKALHLAEATGKLLDSIFKSVAAYYGRHRI